MHFNPESVLEELNEFENKQEEVPVVLEEYLEMVAKTGNIMFPWCKLKPLLKRKMDLVITEFSKSCPPDTIPSLPNTEMFNFESFKSTILEAVDTFQNAPFTIQRLCELITDPKKHYNRTDKYMRGLEKNLLVVSTIEPLAAEHEAPGQNRIQPAMVNGGISNSNDVENEEVGHESNTLNEAPPVNGTVLENFATVFPTANRITNASSSLQVAMVTGPDVYQTLEPVTNFEYSLETNVDANGTEAFLSVDEHSSVPSDVDTTTVIVDNSADGEVAIQESVDQVIQTIVESCCRALAMHTLEAREEHNEFCDPVEEDSCEEPDAKRLKLDDGTYDDISCNDPIHIADDRDEAAVDNAIDESIQDDVNESNIADDQNEVSDVDTIDSVMVTKAVEVDISETNDHIVEEADSCESNNITEEAVSNVTNVHITEDAVLNATNECVAEDVALSETTEQGVEDSVVSEVVAKEDSVESEVQESATGSTVDNKSENEQFTETPDKEITHINGSSITEPSEHEADHDVTNCIADKEPEKVLDCEESDPLLNV